MKNTKSIFLALCIGIVLSFLLCGYSLIMCFANAPEGDAINSHVLEIIYLFIHLFACAILFYLCFRAFRFGSFFVENVVLDEHKNLYKGKLILHSVLAGVFLVIAVYSTLQVAGLSLPLKNEIDYVVWHDLMNAMYLLFMLFLAFVLYPFACLKDHTEEAK